MKKDRWFSIVTYTDISVLKKVLESNGSKIRAYAYIEHDKDVVDYHIHLMLYTYDPYTYKGIRNWFRAAQNPEDERNTFVQTIIDRKKLFEYLTHKNEDNEKFKYDVSKIVSCNVEKLLEEESKDESYDCLQDFMSGISYRELARRYGRDFIYHFQNYKMLCLEIAKQERLTSIVTGLSESDPCTEDFKNFLDSLTTSPDQY